jgi:hypothetical protein
MEQLQLLGVALGLASLSGLNLYLTVFATGLSIQQHWITLAPQYSGLEALANPAIIAVAGAMYFIQFFADKVPWVDSLWDSIHTVIRPIGGALLAIRVLGPTNGVFDVIVALLAGSVTLATHGLKAGTRLVANGSPEPFSNIGLSVAEDASVLGGLALLHYSPIAALVLFTAVLVAIFYFAPKMARMLRVKLWLIWKKLNAPASDEAGADDPLPDELPADFDLTFHRLNVIGERVLWAVPCISAASRSLPGNLFGYLIATVEAPKELHFVARRGLTNFAKTFELDGYKVSREAGFLSENLVLHNVENKNPKRVFMLDRTRAPMVRRMVDSVQQRLAAPVHNDVEAAVSAA